jgi:hypothetical protein
MDPAATLRADYPADNDNPPQTRQPFLFIFPIKQGFFGIIRALEKFRSILFDFSRDYAKTDLLRSM